MMVIAIGALFGCDEGLGPLSSVDAPRALTVEPVSLNAVRLTWDRVAHDDIAAYRVERRKGNAVEEAQLRARLLR